MILDVRGVGFFRPGGQLGGQPILRDVTFALAAGDVMCVLGPNGVGKTTLIRCLAGLERVQAGRIRLDGQDLSRMSRRAIGQRVGVVPQADSAAFHYSVAEMVEMGRAAHLGPTAAPGAADRAIVAGALDRLGIAHLARRAYPELSGGERQMVLIARALAQQPRLLLLDEPTSHLDFANQAQALDLVSGLAESGLAVVMTTHDPSHAFRVASQVLLMRRDLSSTAGKPRAVHTGPSLSAAYGRTIALAEAGGRTVCVI